MSESIKVTPNGQWKLVKAYGGAADDSTNPGIPMTADGIPVATARTAAAQPWRAGDTFAAVAPAKSLDPSHPRFLPQTPPREARTFQDSMSAVLRSPAYQQGAVFNKVPALVKPPTLKPGQTPWAGSSPTPVTGSATHTPPASEVRPNIPPVGGNTNTHVPTAKSEATEKLSVSKSGQWSLGKAEDDEDEKKL